jgi:hypothetical protein
MASLHGILHCILLYGLSDPTVLRRLLQHTELAPYWDIVVTLLGEPADLDTFSKQDTMGRTAKVEHPISQSCSYTVKDCLTQAHLPC